MILLMIFYIDFETFLLGEPTLKGVSQNVKIYNIISHNLPKSKKIIDHNTKRNIQIKNRVLSGNSLLIFCLIFLSIFIFIKINSKITLDNDIEEIVEKERSDKPKVVPVTQHKEAV